MAFGRGVTWHAIVLVVVAVLTWSSATASEAQQCRASDILYILDSSGSIGRQDYDQMKTFVASLTTNVTLRSQNFRFGLIIFSNNAQIVFNFSKYTSKEDLYQAIVDAPYIDEGTASASALRLARLTSFSPEAGARQHAEKVAIVFTDGISENVTETAYESNLLKGAGVKVISVGIGSKVDRAELLTIASAADLVFTVDNFQGLNAISSYLLTSLCNQILCVANQNCSGRRNGDYPACDPECKAGYFYSCSNGLAYRMDCALASYTFDNGTRFTARMVYNPTSDTCEREVAQCKRDPTDYVVRLLRVQRDTAISRTRGRA